MKPKFKADQSQTRDFPESSDITVSFQCICALMLADVDGSNTMSSNPILQHSEGDPMCNDKTLFQGHRLANPGDESPDAIRKVPSDQVLSVLRWGSNQRTSSHSKSALQIIVPGRNLSESEMVSAPYTGRSIMYLYTSSSSSSGKTNRSWGAVGDHLSPAKSGSFSSCALPISHEEHLCQTYPNISCAATQSSSKLAELVSDSVLDKDPYKLLVVGETGRYRRSIVPCLSAPSKFHLVPQRRRSNPIFKRHCELCTRPLHRVCLVRHCHCINQTILEVLILPSHRYGRGMDLRWK